MRQQIAILIVLAGSYLHLEAQTWSTYIDERPNYEHVTDIERTPDAGFLIASYTEYDPDIILVKLDSLGQKEWTRKISYKVGTSSWSKEPHLLVEPNGSILVCATTISNVFGHTPKLVFWNISPFGIVIDSILSESMDLKSLFRSKTGNIIAAGNTYICQNQGFDCNEQRSIFILDSTFNLALDITLPWPYNHSSSNPVFDCIELADGRLVMLSGKRHYSGSGWNSTTFLEIFENETYEYSTFLLEQNVGGTFLMEGKIAASHDNHIIVGYNSGNYKVRNINIDSLSEEGTYYFNADYSSFTLTSDNAIVLAGTKSWSDTTVYLKKIWLVGGGFEWSNTLQFNSPQNIHTSARAELRKIVPAHDGGFVLLGNNRLYYPKDTLDGFVIKVDSEGNKKSVIKGHIKADINPTNCVAENEEPGLEHWIVEARGAESSVYSTSDSQGEYALSPPETDFKMYFYKPGIDSSLVCQYGLDLSLRNKIDTTTFNVAVQGYSSCPLVSMDVGIPLVRNCTANTYTVRYCNFGYSQIDTMVFKIEPSQYMEFIASSLPYEIYDSTYLFTAYNLEPGECRSLTFSVFLDCQTPAGWEHCLKAQIVLDSLCILSPNLSQDPLSDIDCQTSGMPFDPNDKTAAPLGEGSNREIPNDTQINYTIRFQNIGTDTAFQVVIRDTLDDNLTIGTFSPGVSSHDFDWNITEMGILEFVFSNIQLPDSSIDAERSQGFVTFSILPRPSLIPGTKIQNVASIYFDYTQPIVTNVVSQTIRKEIVSYEIDTIVCPGEYVYGIVVDSDSSWTEINEGVYTDTLIHIRTMAWPTQDSIFNWDFCQGDIDPLSGNPFGEVGVFNETLHFTNQFGCDSTHNYSFTIHPVSNDTVWLEFPSGSLYKDIILERDTILVEQDTSSHGCTIQLTEIISVLSTGISEIHAENLYSINPNPFSSCFWIQPKSEKSIIKAISLSDLIGQYYFQFDSYDIGPDQKPHCEISDWPPGLYLLQLQDEKGVGVYPILKIK